MVRQGCDMRRRAARGGCLHWVVVQTIAVWFHNVLDCVVRLGGAADETDGGTFVF